MANNFPRNSIVVSNELEIMGLANEEGVPVPVSDWGILRKRIERIGPGKIGYLTAGSLFIGAALAALIQAIAIPSEFNTRIYGIESGLLCLMLFFFFGIIGSMAFWFARQQRKMIPRAKDDALDEMDRIWNRCTPSLSPDKSFPVNKSAYPIIEKAIFRSTKDDKRMEDVTQAVIQMLQNGQRIIPASIDVFPDPHKGTGKMLTIEYKIGRVTIKKTCYERDYISLS